MSQISNLLRFLPDKLYIQLLYFKHFRKFVNFRNPKTFNEKLQWLKLHDRNPLYTTLVDKYEVKKYIADQIGSQYVIPTLGVWDSPEEIDFDALPEQFVLKWNHDSGSVIICKNKDDLDKDVAVEKLRGWKRHNGYLYGREWPYKNVKPRIIAEKYMSDRNGELLDYKFFCFNGVPKVMFVASDRMNPDEDTKFDFFDMNYAHLPFTNGHPNALRIISRPDNFEKMKELAGMLSQDIPQVRVDFYEVDGMIYFGEMTFYHWSGFVPFEPDVWDYKLGEWLKLPR